jgi:pilus assembly protein CpaB
MRLVFGLVLVLGIGLAGFAAYMAKNYIDSYQRELAIARQQSAPKIETVDVYVATRDLKYGEKLDEDAVRLTAFPRQSLPEGIFTKPEALFPEGPATKREVLRSMSKNEVVLANKVTRPGEDAGITSRLESGMRAFAIKVDATSGVSGFLRPGDLVDVYWTGSTGRGNLRTEGDSTGEFTKMIESRLRLIAVDQSADVDRFEAQVARTVTVAASPQQVAALAQAQASGRLTLSLVGAMDDTLSEVIEVDQHRLLGLEEAAVEAPEPAKEECVIRTRRGSEVVVTPIPCTN